jgi:hypothetical protein
MGRNGKSSHRDRRRGESLRHKRVDFEKGEKMEKAISRVSHKRGDDTELIVCQALILLGKQGAIESFRRTSKNERLDRTGVDFVGRMKKITFSFNGRQFSLPGGRFSLQAKSSNSGLKDHQRHQLKSPKKIPGILREPGDGVAQVAKKILESLEQVQSGRT